MASTLPSQTDCCSPCDGEASVAVPGPAGADGADGAAGADGSDAFTLTDGAFVMPAELANVTVTVDDSTWMGNGQILFIETAGFMEVQSKPTATSVILKNLEDTTNLLYTDNAAPTTSIPDGSRVSPGGLQGPEGDNSGTAPNSATYVTITADAGLPSAVPLDTLGTGAVHFDDTSDTLSVKPIGIADNNLLEVDQAAGLTAGDAAFGTANGIETKTASAARTALGLGTMATQAAGAVAITGGSITGITDVAVADGGTGASTAAAARTNLGILGGYGLLGSLTGVDLNVGANDNAFTILSARYRIDKITVENASVSLTAATAGLFTAAGGGGTTLAADQALSALTASTKFDDLTLDAVTGTDVITAGTLYFRVGTAQGAAATADVHLFGWKYD
jgi:hypothetical protein